LIPINKPSDEYIIDILTDFLNGALTHNDLDGWYSELYKKYCKKYSGCISFETESKAAHFLLCSLTYINDNRLVYLNEKPSHFIRNEDIADYIKELKRIDCSDFNGRLRRVYLHQIEKSVEPSIPLISLKPGGRALIDKFGVFFRRGVIDDLAERMEYCAIKFEGVFFFADYTHDREECQFTISSLKSNESKLAELLKYLGINRDEVDWINNEILKSKTELWRLDDNDNDFLMGTYDSFLDAELTRLHYEHKGHKQTYYTKFVN
jgi:hypothetical protein